MLLPPASRSSRSSRSTRFGRERRHLRKLAVVCQLLGGLCVVAAVIFFVMSFFGSHGMQGKKVALTQRKVSAVFLAAAPTLLIFGLGLSWWKYRFYGRGQKRRSSSSAGDGNGHGHNGGNEVPSAAPLPKP
ncbi:MAG: hypothetical protein NTY53_19105 [Kiritimatiellaeota bacterium]|nr:hypothetical protein [Kiritimatiellota bacterium]